MKPSSMKPLQVIQVFSPRAMSALLLAAALQGCASYSGIETASKPLASGQLGLNAAAKELPSQWWQEFGDAKLNTLIETALAESPSLHLADARLRRAEAALAGARASDGPALNAKADLSRQRFSGNSIYPPPLGGATHDLGTLQLGGSWTADFFGRHRAALEGAVGARQAAAADAQAARNLLSANTAKAYVQLARLIAQREIARRALGEREEVRQLTEQRLLSGLDTKVELRQSEARVHDAAAQIEQIEEQIVLTRQALAALSAKPPQALAEFDAALDALRAIGLPEQLPVDLLGRRPDIVAAKWRVEAAARSIDEARADFYPNLDLTAFVGLSSLGLDRLLRSGARQWGAGPALTLPVFDAGRRRANFESKTADYDIAVESYNAAVLDAVHEAADQLASLGSIARQQAEQNQALEAASEAYEFARQRYQAGLGSYLSVLSAESALLAQRRQAVDLKARALETQILLARALGGGWRATAASGAASNSTGNS